MNASGLDWKHVGFVRLDADGLLAFPSTAERTGLFRMTIAAAAYVGTTENLRRSLAQIRSPGPSQATNIRLRDLAIEALRRGDRVQVEFCIADRRSDRVVDLRHRDDRAAAARAEIERLAAAGKDVLNRRFP